MSNIIRRQRVTWTTVPNSILDDQALTPESLGVLIWMLSKPDSWEFRQGHIADRFGCGKDRMQSIMRTLVQAGYVRREQHRNELGHICTVTIVSEKPEPGFPAVGSTGAGEASSRETTQLSKDCLEVKTEKVMTDSAIANATATSADLCASHEKPKGKKTTLKTWMANLGDEQAIRPDDPIFDYAQSASMPEGYLQLAWLAFKQRYIQNANHCRKTYIDWRAAFRDHVKGNYLKLWCQASGGEWYLTQAGKAAEMEFNAQGTLV